MPSGQYERSPFCPHGHDKRIGGASKRGACKACGLARNAVYAAARRARRRQERGISGLPSDRLIRILHTRSNAAFLWMQYRGCDWDSAVRASARLWGAKTIRVDMADDWCLAAGEDLIVVYPEAYERGVA